MPSIDPSVVDDIKPVGDTISDLSKVVDILLNDKYKKRKTILSNRQVPSLTTLEVLAQLYDIEFLKHWVDSYGEWRTSGDGGKGRKDIVDITKFSLDREESRHNDMMNALGRR